MSTHDHDHGHEHGHSHAHGDDDLLAEVFEGGPPDDFEILEIAIRELLFDKGVITPDELRAKITEWDAKTPENGARLVARAWVDPDFKTRLVEDFYSAAAELDIDVAGPMIVAVENTDDVHNVFVCTLCSCYPRAVLGIPPEWYKSKEYRSRVVVNPRGVLQEFGTNLPDSVDVRVIDNTAESRYFIIPKRPAGTGDMSEEELAALVTRDSIIGVTEANAPG
jgi:nitrile hydratase